MQSLISQMAVRVDQSESRLKSARRVTDDWVAAGGPDDGDDVESRRRLGAAVAAEIKLRGLGDLMRLEFVDLLFRRWVVIRASLHFDEDERLPITSHDVDL